MTIAVHVKAWSVLAAVDWPPGAAKRWPGEGRLAQPKGDNRPAIVVVATERGGQVEAATEAQQALAALGHRWSMLLRVTRLPDVENQAAELVQEALERAAHDSKAERNHPLGQATAIIQDEYPAMGSEEFRKKLLDYFQSPVDRLFQKKKGGDNGGS